MRLIDFCQGLNAALFAIGMLAQNNKSLSRKLIAWKKKQTDSVKLRPS